MSLGSLLCIALLFAHQATLYRFIYCTIAVMFGFGLIAPATSQAVLDPIPSRAGIFSAIMNSFQMLCMSASSAIVVLGLQRLGPAALPDSMLAFSVFAWLLLPQRPS
jgi:predicted MFS family arabinose efflux permease